MVAPPDVPENKPAPVSELLEAAWASVRDMLTEDSARWEQAKASPIAQSSEPAKAAVLRGIAEEQMAALVHAALEFQMRLALAQKHRSLNMAVVGPLLSDLAGFAQAAAQGRTVTCRNAPCDFKGQAAQAGPTGACPSCGKRVTPDAPPQAILGPNGQALHV